MKKKTYQILTGIPVVGKVIALKTDSGNSFAFLPLHGSPVREAFNNDPRGFDEAFKESYERIIAPAKEYVQEHPDVQLTAGLVNRLEIKKLLKNRKR